MQNGQGSLVAGEAPEATLPIEGLAGLFSGYCDTAVHTAQGMLHADGSATERLDAIFVGPAPWLPDMF